MLELKTLKRTIIVKKLISYRYILTIFIALFFTACNQKNIQIADLTNYSQNPSTYTKNLSIILKNQNTQTKKYIKNFFIPWNIKKLTYTKEEASWGNYYTSKKVYLENHNLASKYWFEKQISNSNFEKYNTKSQKAITVKNANIRVFPTINKMFFNPKKAGEGFPFDYNQNSTIKINTPILISHYSKDKAWVFVQSHFVIGWLRVDNIALVDKNFEELFKTNEYSIATQDSFAIFDTSFIEYIKLGTFFPKKDSKYLVAKKSINSYAILQKINISKDKVSTFPIKLNSKNVTSIANEFIGELYGWGGLNNHRDCSSFTQDFFTPFGIYLKRNSKEQTKLHKYIDLSKLKEQDKKEFIKQKAIPFLTLVYLKGHIMLYIGIKNNEPMVMHNMWGVRTKDIWNNSDRNIVGKTVITTLEPGIELSNVDKNKTLLKKVQGIVLLNQNIKAE